MLPLASDWFWDHGWIITDPIFITYIGFVRIAVTVLTKYRRKERKARKLEDSESRFCRV